MLLGNSFFSTKQHSYGRGGVVPVAVRASVDCANEKYANGFPSLLEEINFGASYALRASVLICREGWKGGPYDKICGLR